MSEETDNDFWANPSFNQWLDENYPVEIEDYKYPSGVVLYRMSNINYAEALARYNTDPKVSLSRIEQSFPTPIAYYFYQAVNNYQNDHHRLDLLKSCWESVIFFVYGLVIGEAIHRKLDLKSIGIKWSSLWSDKLHDRFNITENILDYAVKSGIKFGCKDIIPISTIGLIRKLNQERNGFAHSWAMTEAGQKELYQQLYPQLVQVLKELIKLEEVRVFRYHSAEIPLYPRCEIFSGSSLEGKKEIIPLKKDNYFEIVDHFDANTIFAQVAGDIFCVAPFIHFAQETHETNAVLCFYKQCKDEKYQFEVVSKSQSKAFEKCIFETMVNQLKGLVG